MSWGLSLQAAQDQGLNSRLIRLSHKEGRPGWLRMIVLQSKKKKRWYGLAFLRKQYNAVLTLAAVLPSGEKCKRLDELQ